MLWYSKRLYQSIFYRYYTRGSLQYIINPTKKEKEILLWQTRHHFDLILLEVS